MKVIDWKTHSAFPSETDAMVGLVGGLARFMIEFNGSAGVWQAIDKINGYYHGMPVTSSKSFASCIDWCWRRLAEHP